MEWTGRHSASLTLHGTWDIWAGSPTIDRVIRPLWRSERRHAGDRRNEELEAIELRLSKPSFIPPSHSRAFVPVALLIIQWSRWLAMQCMYCGPIGAKQTKTRIMQSQSGDRRACICTAKSLPCCPSAE
jgi:hypothetical protein